MRSNNRYETACCFLFVAFVSFIGLTYGQTTKWPETPEEKIDALATAAADGIDAKAYLLPLGSDVVPIITQKLRQSLAEGSSAEGAQAFAMLDMPQADQKRAGYQIGLVALQGVALREMSLDMATKKAALNSLYLALKSPYMISRRSALYAAANGGDISAVDEIVPLLNDTDKSNRVIAAQMLAKIGDALTADKIESVLEKRRLGLTEEQIEHDWSFRHGYKAIEELRSKATAAPQALLEPPTSHSSTPKPIDSATPAVAEEAKQSPSSFPIVPVAILALAIIGVSVVLLRRKSP